SIYIRENERSLYDAAWKFHSSWKEACEKLGIETEGRLRWSKEKVITDIIRLHENGEVLSSRNITRLNNPLIKAASRYYKSWENAVTMAGLNYKEIKKQGREEGFKLRSENTKKKILAKNLS